MRRALPFGLITLLLVAFGAARAPAQSDPAGFDTVVDIDHWEQSLTEVGSSTQVNLLNQGLFLSSLALGPDDGSGRNIELNLLGGYVGGVVTANAGSVVNVVSGDIHSLTARSGSQVNLLGGSVNSPTTIEQGARVLIDGGQITRWLWVDGEAELASGELSWYVRLQPGARFSFTGGSVGDGLLIPEGGQFSWSGGSVGERLQAGAASLVEIAGADFAIDGIPVQTGQNTIALPDGALLSGTLADGVPFALSAADGDLLPAGGIRLLRQPPEPPAPLGTPLPADLRGLRQGQTAVLNSGDQLGDNFNVGQGGLLIVSGGQVGSNLELVGANAILLDGAIGPAADLFHGAGLAVSGGVVGAGLQVHNGGVLTVSGGALDRDAQVLDGGWAFLRGGLFGSGLTVEAGGELHLSGGSLGETLTAGPGAGLLAVGEGFKINGQSVPLAGGRATVTLAPGESLTGVLADGTPFAFSPDDGDTLDTIELQHSPAPAIAWTERTVTGADESTRALRAGQTLTVTAGGSLPADLHAGGGVLRVDGGIVGSNLEAADTHVVLVDGDITFGLDLFAGSVLDVEGGRLGSQLQAHAGSRVNVRGGFVGSSAAAIGSELHISGGIVDGSARAASGAQVQITGGVVRSGFTIDSGAAAALHDGVVDDFLMVRDGGRFEMLGGRLGRRAQVDNGGRVEIAGGVVGEMLRASEGGQLELVGAEFRLNGQPIPGLAGLGDALAIDLQPTDVLTGVLADGTPVLFSTADRADRLRRRDRLNLGLDLPEGVLFNGDYFAPGTVTLRRAAAPAALPGRVEIGDAPPVGVRGGQFVLVEQGQSLPADFAAGRGASVIVSGGEVGGNLEASGATVLLTSGQIGPYFDAFNGSTVTVAGGEIGQFFDAVGSTVVVTGGRINRDFNALLGATVLLSGGELWGDSILYHSRLEATGGYAQELHVYDGALARIDDQAQVNRMYASRGGAVRLDGGYVGLLELLDGAEAVIAGADLQALDIYGAADVTFEGVGFWLNGVDLTPQLAFNTPLVLDQQGVLLETLHQDGQVSRIWLGDFLNRGAEVRLLRSVSLPGDYNRDGLVDAADYLAWRDAYGQTGADLAADGNADGVVDAADYGIWRDSLAGEGGRGRRNVPEPAAALLLALGGVGAALRVRCPRNDIKTRRRSA